MTFQATNKGFQVPYMTHVCLKSIKACGKWPGVYYKQATTTVKKNCVFIAKAGDTKSKIQSLEEFNFKTCFFPFT